MELLRLLRFHSDVLIVFIILPLPLCSALAYSPSPVAAALPELYANLTAIMARNGCFTFSRLLSGVPDAARSFADNLGSGLTAFCPVDDAMRPFLPAFKNLTADAKLSLLLYHAVPVYCPFEMLQDGNGVVSTLATGAATDYKLAVQNDGDQVTLRTGAIVATITATLVDRNPLAVYAIDAVLEPVELFEPAQAPELAPAPEVAEKAASAKASSETAEAPAGAQEAPVDEKATAKSAAARNGVYLWAAVGVVVAMAAAAA
ncbi:fasciclin-like arabinogalactan protein 1 isoform X1 [Curcuma longa]|uniref:fasciclin-like arabinogalactan protein 1 isoform X1 n=2 Tax=Curcuma longa TaxID=136217 RepID=UPI003D9EB8CE